MTSRSAHAIAKYIHRRDQEEDEERWERAYEFTG